MTKNTRFSPEVRQRAIRMVLESQGEYDSQWAAICSIAPKIGCTAKWHLNRSQFGIRIDHDLAFISDHSLASQSITIWHASDH